MCDESLKPNGKKTRNFLAPRSIINIASLTITNISTPKAEVILSLHAHSIPQSARNVCHTVNFIMSIPGDGMLSMGPIEA